MPENPYFGGATIPKKKFIEIEKIFKKVLKSYQNYSKIYSKCNKVHESVTKWR